MKQTLSVREEFYDSFEYNMIFKSSKKFINCSPKKDFDSYISENIYVSHQSSFCRNMESHLFGIL